MSNREAETNPIMKFPWYLAVLFIVLVGLVAARILGLDGHSARISVAERADHVLVRWTGDIERPMYNEIATAIGQRRGDPRPIVLVLGSLGGSVYEGGRVIELVREMQRTHAVDTHVETHCGSMCVPIFLAGTRRTAAAKANFMFHEVRFRGRDGQQRTPQDKDLAPAERTRIALATDSLFRAYFEAPRVNRQWLTEMRRSIVGTDIWLKASELHKQGSGVIDGLLEGR
jgi:ATP-dependent protease ClpP protease subunit